MFIINTSFLIIILIELTYDFNNFYYIIILIMNKQLFSDASNIIDYSINEVLPNKSIKKIFNKIEKPKGKAIMIAIGKAAYTMASEFTSNFDITKGLVITKYGHAKSKLPNTEIIEAGHPILDNNSLISTSKAIDLCNNLTKDDIVYMLISGGGSSLFEYPFIDLKELQDINDYLIKSGASINEINCIRKRLSKVKGGRFAEICKPAKIINIVLSDVIGDSLDVIASGPTYPDSSSYNDVTNVIKKYNLHFNETIMNYLKKDAINSLDNIETYTIGNNSLLKKAAAEKAQSLGYKTKIIDKDITEDINNVVEYLKSLLDNNKYNNENICIIAGGELTIEVKGSGLGGRNQELACRMIPYLLDTNACMFAISSDGTDGPTNAAGGYVDKDSYNPELNEYLMNNDSYHYLEKYNKLIKIGPTGTNVCDLYCILIKNKA